jgi:hypothetical protein
MNLNTYTQADNSSPNFSQNKGILIANTKAQLAEREPFCEAYHKLIAYVKIRRRLFSLGSGRRMFASNAPFGLTIVDLAPSVIYGSHTIAWLALSAMAYTWPWVLWVASATAEPSTITYELRIDAV